ncbi:MAG: hypothetical protein GY752_11705 [bacterium]|nr:hypothetical protein [bacterium]MCP4799294.1 hypothetical protein [bacterium]
MEINNNKKYPEGHFLGLWMGIGVAIFSGLGISLSVATNNYGLIGVGPAIGMAFGLSIGQAIENKYKKENKIRPLTEEEKKRRKIAVMAGLAMLILGVIAFSLMLFL